MRKTPCFSGKKGLLVVLVIFSAMEIWLYNQYSANFLSRIYFLSFGPRHSPCFNSHWVIVTKDNLYGKMTCVPSTSGWTILVPADVDLPGYTRMIVGPEIVAENDKSLLLEDKAWRNIPLYVALKNGAQVIYQVNDLRYVSPTLNKHFYEKFEYHLEATGKGAFNPYRHFGQLSIRPRGYPSTFGNKSMLRYSVSSEVSSYIIHLISNRQLFYTTSGQGLNVTFDVGAPPIFLTSGLWSPINVMNTLFRNETLWAVVRPITTSPTEADIIHGYWTQRLLWEIGGKIGFVAFEGWKLNDGALQSPASKTIDKTASDVVSMLDKWECKRDFTFFQCVEDLSKRMADFGIWAKEDVKCIKTWLNFLRDLGYSEPIRKPYPAKALSKPMHPVHYQSSEQENPLKSPSTQLTKVMSSVCPTFPITLHYNDLVHVQEPDIVLVVSFTFPFYENIRYQELFYGTVFSHIVYCGPNVQKFINITTKYSLKLSFVEVEPTTGILAYQCLSTAMKMNFNTRGYLYVSDDVLLNSWNLHKLPYNKAWINGLELMDMYQNSSSWMWWARPSGKEALTNSWKELLHLEKETRYKKMIGTFLTNLEKNTGSPSGFFIGGSDIVYIPRKLVSKAIFFLDLFKRHGLFLEIVYPTMIAGLALKNDIYFMKGQYYWYDGKRDRIPELFKPNDIFLHPLKLSQIKGPWNKFVCGVVFPLIYDKKKKRKNPRSKSSEKLTHLSSMLKEQ